MCDIIKKSFKITLRVMIKSTGIGNISDKFVPNRKTIIMKIKSMHISYVSIKTNIP